MWPTLCIVVIVVVISCRKIINVVALDHVYVYVYTIWVICLNNFQITKSISWVRCSDIRMRWCALLYYLEIQALIISYGTNQLNMKDTRILDHLWYMDMPIAYYAVVPAILFWYISIRQYRRYKFNFIPDIISQFSFCSYSYSKCVIRIELLCLFAAHIKFLLQTNCIVYVLLIDVIVGWMLLCCVSTAVKLSDQVIIMF